MKWIKVKFFETKWFCYIYTASLIAVYIGCIFYADSQQSSLYPYNYIGYTEKYSIVLLVLFLIFINGISIFVYNNFHNIKFLYLIAVFQLFIVAFSKFIPNIFTHDSYHAHAYTNSIFNVLGGYPYSNEMQSIYGHYGLFFYVPTLILSIFVNKTIAVYVIIAIIVVIEHACIFRSLFKVINNKGLLLLCLFAITWRTIVTDNVYWQLIPHRWFFPSILMLYCIDLIKAKNKIIWKKIVVGWIICGLSILWNLETGIVCSFTFAAFILYKTLSKDFLFSKEFIFTFFNTIISLILSFIGSYLLFNFCNIILGGSWENFKSYIFPIASQSYHIEKLNVSLPAVYNSYAIQTAMYTAVILYSLAKVRIFSKNKLEIQDNLYVMLVISVMGLGLLCYYINRAAAGNLSITYFTTVFLICLICDQILPQIGGGRKKLNNRSLSIKCVINKSLDEIVKISFAGIMFGILAFLAFEGVTSIGDLWVRRSGMKTEIKQLSSYKDTIDYIIPEDTFCFGSGSQELYGLLGWDVKCHTIDASDMIKEEKEYILREAEKESAIFTNYPDLVKPLHFVRLFEIWFGKVNYFFMIKEDLREANETKQIEYKYLAWNILKDFAPIYMEDEFLSEIADGILYKDSERIYPYLYLKYNDDEYLNKIYYLSFQTSISEKELEYWRGRLLTLSNRAKVLLEMIDVAIEGNLENLKLPSILKAKGVYGEEHNAEGDFHWAEKNGELTLYNYDEKDVMVRLSGKIYTNSFTEGERQVIFTGIGATEKVPLTLNQWEPFSINLKLKPGSNLVCFKADAPYLEVEKDDRNLCFMIEHLRLEVINDETE